MEKWIETYRGTVYPWHCDHMGHMNVMWYVGKFDEATWQLFASAGLTGTYLRENSRGMAGVQENISYKAELRAGDVIAIRSRVLEVRNKAVRFVHEMINLDTAATAATAELIAVQIDTVTRKACAFAPQIRSRWQQMILASKARRQTSRRPA